MSAIQNAIDQGVISTSHDFTHAEMLYSLWSISHGMGMLKLTNLRDIDADFESTNRKALEIFVEGVK